MPEIAVPRSFRDPDGFIFSAGNRLLRYIAGDAVEDVREFLASPLAAAATTDGSLVRSAILENPEPPNIPEEFSGQLPAGALILEHERLFFPNYPYEWPPAMLAAAGDLTLDLARKAIAAGFSLKDATPYNVIYNDAQPVFIDLLSFRRRHPTESVWLPYAQFVRTFVLPLLANRHFGLHLDEILQAHRDGIEPARMWTLVPAYRRFSPAFFSAVTLPVLMAGRADRAGAGGGYAIRHARDEREATFLLERLFARAARLLARASRPPSSQAAGGMYAGHPYDAGELAAKDRFLAASLERVRPRTVLDVGCNTGRFSLMAARIGSRVVSVDRDDAAVDGLWRAASRAKLAILPLVVDIGWPPGALGWRNRECPAFLDRARGKFDCVLMLALLHHLLVNERVPLSAVFELAAELTTAWAIVEYVDPHDPNFQKIARGREWLHRDLTRENFESSARPWFEIVDTVPASATRHLYLLRKKSR